MTSSPGDPDLDRPRALDWVAWHQAYDWSSALQERLRTVRDQIAYCLAGLPAGRIAIVSVCAGDGRDLIGVLAGHPRVADVTARLIELDPELVKRGREAAIRAGLGGALEFVRGDAAMAAVYAGAVPAHVLVVTGVFGNIVPAETPGLVRNLSRLCATGGYVVWTRHVRFADGAHHAATIRQLFGDHGFEEVCASLTPEARYLVATHRHVGAPSSPLEEPLFTFSGVPGRRVPKGSWR